MSRLTLVIVAALRWSVPDGASAQIEAPSADRALARDILRELVEINTTDSLGNTPRAARAMARRLVAAGFPLADVRVLIGPDAKHGNLVARYRGTGTGGRPIIGFAHLDVVPARRGRRRAARRSPRHVRGASEREGICDVRVGSHGQRGAQLPPAPRG